MFNFPKSAQEHTPTLPEVKDSMTEGFIDFDQAEKDIFQIYNLIGKKNKPNDEIFEELNNKKNVLSSLLKTRQESISFVTSVITRDPKYLNLGELKNLIEKKYPRQYKSILDELGYFKNTKKLLKYWKESIPGTQKHITDLEKQIKLLNGLENAYSVDNQEKTEATLFGIEQANIITLDVIKNVFAFQKLEKAAHKKTFLTSRQARGLETNLDTAVKNLQMIRDFELDFYDYKINNLSSLKATQIHNADKIDTDIKHYQNERKDKKQYFSKLIIEIHRLSSNNIINDNLEILNEKKAKGKNGTLIEKAKVELKRFKNYNKEALKHTKEKHHKFTSFLTSAGASPAENNTDLIKQLFLFNYKKNQKGISISGKELQQIEAKIKEYKQYFSTPRPEKEKQEKIKDFEKFLENNKPLLKIKALQLILSNYISETEPATPLDNEIKNANTLSKLKKEVKEKIDNHVLTLKTIEEVKNKKRK